MIVVGAPLLPLQHASVQERACRRTRRDRVHKASGIEILPSESRTSVQRLQYPQSPTCEAHLVPRPCATVGATLQKTFLRSKTFFTS